MATNVQCKYWVAGEDLLDEYTLLIAGTIGSGKSVLIDSLIYNLATRDCVIGIIDLKRVQYNKWDGLPHLRDLGIAKDIDSALAMIDRVISIMESRYAEMERTCSEKYNGQQIFLIIDEMAHLMSYAGVQKKLEHLMRLCRAARIGVIAATQSPNRKVIPASLWDCTTAQFGLHCTSGIQSRQIIAADYCTTLPQYGWGVLHNASGYCKYKIPMFSREDIDEQIRKAQSCAKGYHRGLFSRLFKRKSA